MRSLSALFFSIPQVDSEGVTHCLSICQAINSEPQRAKHQILQDLWDGTATASSGRLAPVCHGIHPWIYS